MFAGFVGASAGFAKRKQSARPLGEGVLELDWPWRCGLNIELFMLRESRRGGHEPCEHGSDRRETSATGVSDDLQF